MGNEFFYWLLIIPVIAFLFGLAQFWFGLRIEGTESKTESKQRFDFEGLQLALAHGDKNEVRDRIRDLLKEYGGLARDLIASSSLDWKPVLKESAIAVCRALKSGELPLAHGDQWFLRFVQLEMLRRSRMDAAENVKVQIGVLAPTNVPVDRLEVYEAIHQQEQVPHVDVK